MLQNIDFRVVVGFTRFELLGRMSLPTPSDFIMLSDEEQKDVYNRLWDAVMNACTYMTAALNIDELQAQYK